MIKEIFCQKYYKLLKNTIKDAEKFIKGSEDKAEEKSSKAKSK